MREPGTPPAWEDPRRFADDIASFAEQLRRRPHDATDG